MGRSQGGSPVETDLMRQNLQRDLSLRLGSKVRVIGHCLNAKYVKAIVSYPIKIGRLWF